MAVPPQSTTLSCYLEIVDVSRIGKRSSPLLESTFRRETAVGCATITHRFHLTMNVAYIIPPPARESQQNIGAK
jgi:hypothetical protein